MSATKMPASAYAYPLLIKQLLHTPMALAADQEIVYRDQFRYRYRDFRSRLARLANLLGGLGARHGSTVAVMDWDSHRYLECYFAVPMIGATLVTVNVRLSPQQIAYCLNHAKADILLVHRDFLPVIDQLRGELATIGRLVLIADGGDPALPAGFAGNTRACWPRPTPRMSFRNSTRIRAPPASIRRARRVSRRRSPSAIARSCCTPWAPA
jgi:acyl-CoA synthetase (AMP-forming)/AMP-acid ligase II